MDMEKINKEIKDYVETFDFGIHSNVEYIKHNGEVKLTATFKMSYSEYEWVFSFFVDDTKNDNVSESIKKNFYRLLKELFLPRISHYVLDPKLKELTGLPYWDRTSETKINIRDVYLFDNEEPHNCSCRTYVINKKFQFDNGLRGGVSKTYSSLSDLINNIDSLADEIKLSHC